MSCRRAALVALLPFALHGLTREVDSTLGVLLHTSLDLPDFFARVIALLAPAHALAVATGWTAAGGLLWLLLARARHWQQGEPMREALARESWTFAPLLLRPAITILALASLAACPTFPYGFTLPVALTQDLSVAQDAAALAAMAAARLPPLRLRGPGAASLVFLALLAYAHLTPGWARSWDGHPGNEPKTLRMAVAFGHGLTLDVEGVSAPMEELPVQPLASSLPRACVRLGREAARLLGALAHGPKALGAGAIEATRVERQTVRGKEGGVFHVLAPGPSVLLAPALRLDRALNLRRGTPGHLAATVLLWNALAGALVGAVFLLCREATGRASLAAVVAGGYALVPPAIFYSFQFYPEMLGALALALLLRWLLFVPRWGTAAGWLLGLGLAGLPWLHQKFLPVSIVLAALFLYVAVDRIVRLRVLLGLLLPPLGSLFMFALYNFAITGSARPDALYLAWGPRGVSTGRVGQGLLGLLLDARYGILPYVPVFALGLGALRLPGAQASRLRWALLPALVYYVTVASADNWSGAVCNLGRYVMPVTPVLAALLALILARTSSHRGVVALALTLLAWSALLTMALRRDPLAASDGALLLARSAFADGNVYIPNLFLRSWSEAAPGLWARVAVWGVLLVAMATWTARSAAGHAGTSAARTLVALAAILLASAFFLERWPSPRTSARFPNAVELRPGTVAFLEGAALEGDTARAEAGRLRFLVRSRVPLQSVTAALSGAGAIRVAGRPPVRVTATGARVELPLAQVVSLRGRRGLEETLYRQEVEVMGDVRLTLESP